MSEFKEKVVEIVCDIPYGKVMSYGQVALYIGSPRGARQVGWILNSLEGKVSLPWWRVVNNGGRITIKGCRYYSPDLMKKLLVEEGVEVSDDMEFNIEKHRFIPDETLLRKWKLDERYIDDIHVKYNV